MGHASRRKRERQEQRAAGLDPSTLKQVDRTKEDTTAAQTVLSNPITRKVVALKSRDAVVAELRSGSTEEQIHKLDSLRGTGALPESKLRKELLKKSPKEMDKAIRKFRKEGKTVSVDNLCAEVKSTPGFLSMCEKVGLNLAWFENLARERVEALK